MVTITARAMRLPSTPSSAPITSASSAMTSTAASHGRRSSRRSTTYSTISSSALNSAFETPPTTSEASVARRGQRPDAAEVRRRHAAGHRQQHLLAERRDQRRADAEGEADQHVAADQRIADGARQQPAPRDEAGRPVTPDPRLDAEIGEPHDAGRQQRPADRVEDRVLLDGIVGHVMRREGPAARRPARPAQPRRASRPAGRRGRAPRCAAPAGPSRTISDRISNARNTSGMRCAKDFDSGGASRDGLVHGPTVCTNTRRPPKLPASRRSGVAPSSGRVPVQAARVSVSTSGVHSGVAGVNRSRGQCTASKTTCQSIAAAGWLAAGWLGTSWFGTGCPGVRCGGTAWNSTSAPLESTSVSVMPTRRSGGSVRLGRTDSRTAGSAGAGWCDTRSRSRAPGPTRAGPSGRPAAACGPSAGSRRRRRPRRPHVGRRVAIAERGRAPAARDPRAPPTTAAAARGDGTRSRCAGRRSRRGTTTTNASSDRPIAQRHRARPGRRRRPSPATASRRPRAPRPADRRRAAPPTPRSR